MHGIEIFESPILNITAKFKLCPIKIHIPELGPQAVQNKIWETKQLHKINATFYHIFMQLKKLNNFAQNKYITY